MPILILIPIIRVGLMMAAERRATITRRAAPENLSLLAPSSASSDMSIVPLVLLYISCYFMICGAFRVVLPRANPGPLRQQQMSLKMARAAKEFSANPVALVTGASRGIGKAVALALGQAGCRVVVNYASNDEAAQQVCEEIKTAGASKGSNAIAIKANCGNVEEVSAMFKQIKEQFGAVEICVNNAGITRDKLSIVMGPKDFTDVIDLNLNGVFFCSQAAGKMMLEQRLGRIINIASIVGQIGNPGQANYAAAKGGVIAMTKSLAKELGGRNICVNAVCPGFIESDMTKGLNKDALLPLIPLKRFGSPEEVAGLVRFLALDPAAAYMTGHCFNVDGGLAIGAT